MGNRASLWLPNGNQQRYSYDALNRLVTLETLSRAGTPLQRYDYVLHPTGRRMQINELNGRSTQYAYDELYRLTAETMTHPGLAAYTASYQYDAVGNRVYETVDGVQTQYSYDDNDRLLQVGGTTYTYDGHGNTLTETLDGNVVTYGYNAKHQLVERQENDQTTRYSYNVDGIRTQQEASGVATQYIVDSHRDYAQVLHEATPTEAVSYVYGDDLISQQRAGTRSFYHYDGLGSTRALSGVDGALTDMYDYDAFGRVLHQTGTTENSYLFAGEQFDSALDQYYLRARYYDQAIGRFTQMDAWLGNNFDPITLHKYLYANVDPVNVVDPSGYFGLASVSIASNIRVSLSNLQIDIGLNILDGVVSGGSSSTDNKLLGLATLGGPAAFKLLRVLSSKFRKVCNSFDGQTLVSTETGLVAIQEINIGDRVWAYDENNDAPSLQEVVHLIQGEGTKDLVNIELITGEVITATVGHPFYLPSTGQWLGAGELTVEQALLDQAGNSVAIKTINHYP